MKKGILVLFVLAILSCDNPSSPPQVTVDSVDQTAPDAPLVVSSSSITNNQQPTWTWTTSEEPNQTRIRLNGNEWNIRNDLNEKKYYTPDELLSPGEYFLEVQIADQAENWSDSGSYTITIDLTSPEPGQLIGIPLTNNPRPTWSWTWPDSAVELQYRLNEGDWIEINDTSINSYTPETDLYEGIHRLELKFSNNLGNLSPTTSFSITIDRTAPWLSQVTVPQITNNPRPTWSWTSTAIFSKSRYRFVGEGETWIETESSEFTPAYDLVEGDHTLSVSICDEAGNWSMERNATVTIDSTALSPPTISGTVGPTTNTRPNWLWDSQYETVEIRGRLNGGEWMFFHPRSRGFQPENPLSEGSHTFEVQSRDSAGNWSASASYTIIIDITPPTPAVISGTEYTNQDRNGEWSWIWPDDAIRVMCYVNGTSVFQTTNRSITSYTWPGSFSSGANVFKIRTSDAAGNVSISEFTTNYDTTPPERPFHEWPISPPKYNTHRPTFPMRFSSDSVQYRYQIGSGEFIYGDVTAEIVEITPQIDLPIGDTALIFYARDAAGNWSYQTVIIAGIDFTPPEKPVISGESITADTTPTWTWTGPLDAYCYSYRLNGGQWTETENKYTKEFTAQEPLSSSEHLFEIRTRDLAGNYSEIASFTTEINNLLATIPVVTGSAQTNNQRPTWSWTSNPAASDVRCRINGGSWIVFGNNTVTSYTAPSDLADGTVLFEVQFGNGTGSWTNSGTYSTEIDTVPPQPPSVRSMDRAGTQTPTWRWFVGNTSMIQGLRYRIDSGSWIPLTRETNSLTSPTTLSIGSHTFELQAQDLAGNWSTSSSRTTEVQSFSYVDLTVSLNNNSVEMVGGSNYNISFNVFNLGNIDSGSYTVGIYFVDTYSAPTPTDVLLNSSTYTEGLYSCDQRNMNLSVTIPSNAISKTYTIKCIIDPANTVLESHNPDAESNNCDDYTVDVLHSRTPDLDIPSVLQLEKSAFEITETVQISHNIQNIAGAFSSGSFTIRYVLSADRQYDIGDTLMNEYTLSSLSGGETRSITKYLTFPIIPAGQYYIIAFIDSNEQIVELEEGNNTRGSSLITLNPHNY